MLRLEVSLNALTSSLHLLRHSFPAIAAAWSSMKNTNTRTAGSHPIADMYLPNTDNFTYNHEYIIYIYTCNIYNHLDNQGLNPSCLLTHKQQRPNL